jgi:hypothetical protein
MSNGNHVSLRSIAAIPSAIEHLPLAGSVQEQVNLYTKAWTMLERHTLPSGYRASRLANAWLGENNWRLQIVPQRELWKPEMVAPLSSAALRRGHSVLYGTGLPDTEGDRSKVWRVPNNAEDISRFFESHFACCHILFPENLGFAVHGWIDDLAAFAGPDAFLHEVLSPQDIGVAATSEAVAYMDPKTTLADYAEILAPYAPFMIDG